MDGDRPKSRSKRGYSTRKPLSDSEWAVFLRALRESRNVSAAAQAIGKCRQSMCNARRRPENSAFDREWTEIMGAAAPRVEVVRSDGSKTMGFAPGVKPSQVVPQEGGAAKIRKRSWQGAFEAVRMPEGVARICERLIAKDDRYWEWVAAGAPEEVFDADGVTRTAKLKPEPLDKDELRFLADANKTYAGTLIRENDDQRGPTISDLASLTEPELRAALARIRKEREAMEVLRARAEAIPAAAVEVARA